LIKRAAVVENVGDINTKKFTEILYRKLQIMQDSKKTVEKNNPFLKRKGLWKTEGNLLKRCGLNENEPDPL